MDIDATITEINALSAAELHKRWRKRYRRDPPVSLSPKLMREAFIYAQQEDLFGGLTTATRRRLDVLVAKIEGDPAAPVTGDGRLRPGGRLVRDWHGKRYEVEILESGFGYDGTIYNSLTEIARAITGTHWSGPRFFGLNKKPS